MILASISFPKTEYEKMYFRGGIAECGALTLRAGERSSLDTYFGSFAYTKYRDYTRLSGVTLSLEISGEAKISLRTFDGEKEETVREELFSDGIYSVGVSFDELPALAILYPVIEAKTDVTVRNAAYVTEETPDDVHAAIAFCTFRREAALMGNVALLTEERPAFVDRVIVIDNGKTLDVSSFDKDLVSLFQNENYGGSAGFTRGIMEANRAGFSHVILMDDDVEILPDAISKMTAFVSVLDDAHKNAHVSAAMLYATRPSVQHELGARWANDNIESIKCGIDTTDAMALVENMKEEHTEYGAWWCFMLPLSDTDRFGLPLPLFIKFDDVEYGMRTTGTPDAPIITLNGAAVRHDDFDLKYSMHLEYYNIRNQLIMRTLRKNMGMGGALVRLIKTTVKHLFLYRYDAMEAVLQSFEDFLGGAEFLMSTNAEELNTRLMRSAQKASPLSDIEGWHPEMRNYKESPKTSLLKRIAMVLTLGGHLIPSFMLKKSIAAFPLPDAKVKEAFMHKATIQYQLGSDTGYLMKRSFGKFLRGFFRAVGMFFKIIFRFGKAKRSFKQNEAVITSFEFWEKYLGI